MTLSLSRRAFMKAGAAAGGLLLAVDLTGCVARGEPVPDGPDFAPDAFIRIGTDGHVTVVSKHIELGQGAYTCLATIVA